MSEGAKGTDAEERSTDRSRGRGKASGETQGQEPGKRRKASPAPCAPPRVLSATLGRAALGREAAQQGLIAGALAPPSLTAAAPWPAGRPGGWRRQARRERRRGARPRLRTQASDRRWTERPGPTRHQPGALGSPDPALHLPYQRRPLPLLPPTPRLAIWGARELCILRLHL